MKNHPKETVWFAGGATTLKTRRSPCPTMIEFAVGFFAWLASTWIPAFVGLLVIVWASQIVKSRYLTAFALGIFLWFFVDTIQGSALDRKSTRLNSSHLGISYAVFCLKKKTTIQDRHAVP